MKTINILNYKLQYVITEDCDCRKSTEFYYGTQTFYLRKYFNIFGPRIPKERPRFIFRIPLVNIEDTKLVGTDALKNMLESYVQERIIKFEV